MKRGVAMRYESISRLLVYGWTGVVALYGIHLAMPHIEKFFS